MLPQPTATRRNPTRPASQPIAMPPMPDPIYVSDTANAGAERVVPNSAAIGFSATTVTAVRRRRESARSVRTGDDPGGRAFDAVRSAAGIVHGLFTSRSGAM